MAASRSPRAGPRRASAGTAWDASRCCASSRSCSTSTSGRRARGSPPTAEAKERRAQVAELRERNEAAAPRERELRRPSALEREARRLGMVKAGERAYVVEGLPKE